MRKERQEKKIVFFLEVILFNLECAPMICWADSVLAFCMLSRLRGLSHPLIISGYDWNTSSVLSDGVVFLGPWWGPFLMRLRKYSECFLRSQYDMGATGDRGKLFLYIHAIFEYYSSSYQHGSIRYHLRSEDVL